MPAAACDTHFTPALLAWSAPRELLASKRSFNDAAETLMCNSLLKPGAYDAVTARPLETFLHAHEGQEHRSSREQADQGTRRGCWPTIGCVAAAHGAGASSSGALGLPSCRSTSKALRSSSRPRPRPNLRGALCRDVNFMEDGRLLSSIKAHLTGHALKRTWPVTRATPSHATWSRHSLSACRVLRFSCLPAHGDDHLWRE